MKRVFHFLLFLTLFVSFSHGQTDVASIETKCFDETSGVIEKIQHKASNLFSSAKKRLGIVSEEPSGEIKKCDYYHCVMKKMELVDEYDIPDRELFTRNIKKYSQVELPEDLLYECFEMLEKVLNLEKSFNKHETTLLELNGKSQEIEIPRGGSYMTLQKDKSRQKIESEMICEASAEFVQCLSRTTTPTFKYP